MSWPTTCKSLMYCCCNERKFGSLISAGVRAWPGAVPMVARRNARWASRNLQPRRIVVAGIAARSRERLPMQFLFLRRVKRKVQVRIRDFVLAQVVKHWHSAAEGLRRRTHADGVAEGHLSNELRQGRPGGERTKRWYLAFQNLRGGGICSHRVMTDVACGLYDLLAHSSGRLGNGDLLLFSPRNAGQLSQVGDQGPDLWLAQL